MRSAVLLTLSMLIVLNGCANPHANRPAAEIRPDIAPITSEVKYEATYALYRTDGPGVPLHSTRLTRGERVGFRRQSDSSVVAVAGGHTLPLGDGTFAWLLVENSSPNWRVRAAQDGQRVAGKLGSGILLGVLAAVFVAGGVLYGMAEMSQ